MSDSGSDPVIADALGVKKGQLDGIRNPDSDVVEFSQTDPNRIKRLAEDYLKRSGHPRASAAKVEETAAAGSV
jgi:nanoRNase/pAp phosphatase (c-di-AMP/oligoRNAs hydrolase)